MMKKARLTNNNKIKTKCMGIISNHEWQAQRARHFECLFPVKQPSELSQVVRKSRTCRVDSEITQSHLNENSDQVIMD